MSGPSTRAPSPAEKNQYDVELLGEAKSVKLFDFGARLKQLLQLASLEGKRAAKAAAVSDLAKKLLAGVGGRRRRHTKKRRQLKRKTHRRR